MRDGRLTGRDLFRGKLYSTEGEALQGFLMSYYGPDRLPPGKVFVQKPAIPPGEPDADASAGLALVAEYFARELGTKAGLRPSRRGSPCGRDEPRGP